MSIDFPSHKGAQRRLLVLALLLANAAFLPCADKSSTRTVVDFTGRHVSVPVTVRKVYCSVPACSLMVYALAPDRLLVWPGAPLGEKEKSFLPMLHAAQPQGGVIAGRSLNVEALVKYHPDVVLVMGPEHDANMQSLVLQIEHQTGLPAYYFSMTLNNAPEIFTRLGDLLGVPKRGAELAQYCRASLQEVESKVAKIPMNRRPRVYYAGGGDGLQTMPAGEDHIAAIEAAGGVNVAQLPVRQGGAAVTMEQVLMWKPQIILTGGLRGSSPNAFYDSVWSDPLWREIPAVKTRAVYEIPSRPTGWIAPMASVNRVLGVKWLAQLFYPDLFRYDIRKETRTFYDKIYHKQLTEKELDELLLHSLR